MNCPHCLQATTVIAVGDGRYRCSSCDILWPPAPETPAPVEPLSNPEEFDPGIRDVVIWLNAVGFKTTDSGDGYSKAAAIAAGEALPFRHVACVVSREVMFSEADRQCLLFASEVVVEGEQA